MPTTSNTLHCLTVAILMGPVILARQNTAPTQPEFEVASVKRNVSNEFGGSYGARGNQVVIRNYTLRDIILNAYQLQSYQLIGGPGWVNTDRFDILAKAPESVPRDAKMMHTLLADRFKLRAHTETRQIPIYALVTARADKTFGPQLRRSTLDCAAVRASRARGEPTSVPAAVGDGPFCGASTGFARIRTSGYALPDIARQLSRSAGRLVVDRTGLTGEYDVDLAWTPDQVPPGVAIDPTGPSLFTALQEQLGLKLEPATGPADVLVIDGVEAPTLD